MLTPKFIAIEGGDGTGKSTQAGLLAEYMEKQGKQVWLTRAPGGTILGQQIRNILKDTTIKISHKAEELLHAADLAEQAEHILGWMRKGYSVVSDRSFWSSYAFSTHGKQNPAHWENIFDLATEHARPDHVILLKLKDVEVARTRAKVARPDAITKYDNASSEFYHRVNQAYDRFAEAYTHMFTVIPVDGQSIEDVHAQIIGALVVRGLLK